tara:strand:- start:3937 stop:4137 length:201 start_codon:yes stop_codon:yes gene_type:complete
MPETNWKKMITSGSVAELESLISDGDLIISGSQIVLKNLPTSDPGQRGRLWHDNSDGNSRLKVSGG